MLKPNLYIVTLAVADLDRSAAFYRDGLGLGAGAHGGDHVLFELQGELALVVFLRPEFNKTAGQSNSSASDSGISLTYQADSADEVDGLLRRSVQAGGSLPRSLTTTGAVDRCPRPFPSPATSTTRWPPLLRLRPDLFSRTPLKSPTVTRRKAFSVGTYPGRRGVV